jgi:4'-phosphopantetheinyl transferase
MSDSFVLLWGTASLSEQESGELSPLLTPTELARAASLGEVLSQRYLSGRYLARKVGGDILGEEWTSVIPIAHCSECGMDHGPITIEGTDVHISLSSSGSVVVAAGIRGQQIGVDIEQGNLGDSREVAGKAGTYTVSLGSWCEYEAVVKAMGVGNAVSIDELDPTVVSSQYTVHNATQSEKFVLAVAVSR